MKLIRRLLKAVKDMNSASESSYESVYELASRSAYMSSYWWASSSAYWSSKINEQKVLDIVKDKYNETK